MNSQTLLPHEVSADAADYAGKGQGPQLGVVTAVRVAGSYKDRGRWVYCTFVDGIVTAAVALRTHHVLLPGDLAASPESNWFYVFVTHFENLTFPPYAC